MSYYLKNHYFSDNHGVYFWANFNLPHFHLDGANLQMQTHFVPKLMHQKLPYFFTSCKTAELGLYYWSQVVLVALVSEVFLPSNEPFFETFAQDPRTYVRAAVVNEGKNL